MSEETKIVYYLGNEQTPYVSKINLAPNSITLGDFKAAIKKSNFKFFFKSTDADFGVVKEEVTNDASILPLCDNRIVAWLKDPELDTISQCSGTSGVSAAGDKPQPRGAPINSGDGYPLYDRYGSQSTLMSSDIETTSWDSRDDMTEYSTCTDMTGASRRKSRPRRQKYKKKRPRPGSDTTSTYSSSVTDSSMSLNILTVTLNMDGNKKENKTVGYNSDYAEKKGAVAADNRVEPGDMLLQVNEVNFENMSNEDAVRVLRNIVHKPGPITLTVAKCWDPNPDSYFSVPKDEPVRPIDPAVWANHIIPAKGDMHGPSPPYSMNHETSSASSLPESDRYEVVLSTHSDMATVVKHLKMSGSGLDVKTRMWLKITIPNAFIGSDLVDWLQQKVHGLAERRDARKYASSLLKAGYIRHTVNKITFSEQCYYVFGEYTGQLERDMSSLSLVESNSDRDSDALGPLGGGWGGQPGHGYPSYHVPYPGQLSVGPPGMNGNSEYAPPIPPYSSVPPHRNYPDDVSVHSLHRAASEASSYRHHLATFGAGNSSTESESRCSNRSGKSSGSKRRSDGDRNSDTHSQHHTLQRPSAMNSTPGHLRSSQLSFQQAMGHPCDYFVDVM